MKLLTPLQLANHFGFHVETLRRYRKEGGFPKPIRIGKSHPRFILEDVESYFRSRSGEFFR